MLHNPMEDIKQPRLEKREIIIEKHDLNHMEDVLTNDRDRLLFYFAYYEKIKASEMISIGKKDYDGKQGVLFLNNKKAIILNEKTKTVLERLIKNEEVEHLIYNQHYKPMTESGIYYILKKHLKQIGKPEIRPMDLYLVWCTKSQHEVIFQSKTLQL